jgi:hypothetical protein
MLKQNKRLVIFTLTMLTLLVASTFLPASAQLSQWRSLNPTRDGTIPPLIDSVNRGPILYSVHMISVSDGWAVGGTCDIYTPSDCPGNGYMLHWDGVKWRQVLTPPSTGTLASVFAVGTNDVWAVGMGPTVIHWDGTSWVSVSALVLALGVTNLFSVHMLPGGSDGWAVGDGGTTDNIRWSGNWPTGAWSKGPTPNLLPGSGATQVLRAVSLSSPTFGWIVASGGQIFRWDGAGWNSETTPVPGIDMLSVYAMNGNDAWAVGAHGAGGLGTIIRWNGASWTGPMVAPTTGVDYRSIKMVSSTDGWIAGTLDPTSLEGTLLRWNGVAWSLARSWVTVDLNGLFMLPGGAMGAAVGDAETIIHCYGGEWSAQTSPTYFNLYDVYLIASNDGWSVGYGGNIFRWNGQSWHHYETLPSGADLWGLFIRTTSDAWAVGAPALQNGAPPTILRWNGISWTVVSPPGVALGHTLRDVYMLSATEGWAVGSPRSGEPATALKWDGTLWASVPSGTLANDELWSVHVLSSNDGWAVGVRPTGDVAVIVRWNGLAWSPVTAPPGIGGLRSVHFLSPNDGWAVGDPVGTMPDGTGDQASIIHWDGTQWRRVPGPTLGDGGLLSKVYMVSPTDGWAVGYYGTGTAPDGLADRSLIVHWDGMTWNVVATLPVPPTMAVTLRSVFMVGALDGWIASDEGLILHYGPESVPGTTTSMTTVTQTTTSTTVSTTSTSTTSALSTWGVPGFPIESILAGLVAGVAVLAVLRHRPRRQS